MRTTGAAAAGPLWQPQALTGRAPDGVSARSPGQAQGQGQSPTAGADNRAQLAELIRQSRHRSAQSVLGYLEPGILWRDTVTDGVFGRGGAGDGEGEDPDPA